MDLSKENVIGKPYSYSRYRGITNRDRYSLTDEYFFIKKDSCVICTDNEADISSEANVVALFDDGSFIHLGEIPQECEGLKPSISVSSDEITISMPYYLDNDHHHSGMDVTKIDVSKSALEKLHEDAIFLSVLPKVKNLCKAYCEGYTYRNETNVRYSKEKKKIIIDGSCFVLSLKRYTLNHKWDASVVIDCSDPLNPMITKDPDHDTFFVISPHDPKKVEEKVLNTIKNHFEEMLKNKETDLEEER